MKFKSKLKYLLFPGIIGASLIPVIYMTSCSTENIKSIFQRILNAIKAIQSIGKTETVVDQNQNVIQGVVGFHELRKVLFDSFGLTEESFKNDVQYFNIVPNFENNKNVLTIVIKLKGHASWPKEAIYSELNLENPYHSKDAYYWLKDNTLMFDVSNVKFKNIAISSNPFTIEKLQKSLEESNLNLDDTNNQLNIDQKFAIFDNLSNFDNSFIPSSISLDNSEITYKKLNKFYSINDLNKNETKYDFDFKLKANNGFVIVEDNKYNTQLDIYDVIFDIIDVNLVDKDKVFITNVLNSYSHKFNQLDSIDKTYSLCDEIFKKLQENGSNLLKEHVKKVEPQFINNSSNDFQNISLNISFSKNIRFDKFSFDENETGIQLKTATWFDNMLVSSEVKTQIPKQIIEITTNQILDLRNSLTSLFNEFLAKNKELILNDSENDYWIVEDLLDSQFIMDKVSCIFSANFKEAKISQIDINSFMLGQNNHGTIDVYIRVNNEQFINLESNNTSDAETIWNDKVLYLPEISIIYK